MLLVEQRQLGGNIATIRGIVIRIVVDTNIFVGACLGTGAAGRVISACLQGHVRPLMGTALFSEYEDVLSRADLFDGCRLTNDERQELLDIFSSVCEWTRVYYAWRPNLPDESDNHFVELAVAGQAQYVVTRNLRDLARAELKFPGIRVLGPEDFLTELNR